MSEDNLDFFEKPYRPLDKMLKEELEQELQQWRNMWTWLDPEVQYWLTKVGEAIRVSLRNSQTFLGTLGAVQYEPKMIRLSVYERLYDYSRGEATYENKDVLVKISDLVSYQFIYHKEVKEEDFNPPKEGDEVVNVPDIE